VTNENLVVKSKEITNDLGFDMILDFSGRLGSLKRPILKVLGVFSKILTTCNDPTL
jgi:threonine dehydrogenase-like Zn-dependent dehydrogenase